MRGWLHAGVFPLALVGGIVLIVVSRSAAAVAACSVYALSACLLFATSAVYHRGTWGPRGEAGLRRLDHANIFLIIAGTYTPLAVLLLPEDRQWVLLALVWAGALAGVAFRTLWIGAPRWLYTPMGARRTQPAIAALGGLWPGDDRPPGMQGRPRTGIHSRRAGRRHLAAADDLSCPPLRTASEQRGVRPVVVVSHPWRRSCSPASTTSRPSPW
ncbi:PAQR family membrane homeostasis protein TrhA [Streptomyces sp. NPDC003483]